LQSICGKDSRELETFEIAYSFRKYLQTSPETEFPYEAFPLLQVEYDPVTIEGVATSVGWRRPGDVLGISSNCYACHLHNYLKKQRYPREQLRDASLSLVGKKLLSRDQLEAVLEVDEDMDVVRMILEKVGIEKAPQELATVVTRLSKRLR